jgi:hypothetical protein
MKPVLLILILYSVVFFQCRHSENAIENIYSDYSESVHLNRLYRTWQYGFPFYSSELTIDSNGTFAFHNQGCTGHGYSEGTWIRIGQELVLTSYGRYKEQRRLTTSTVVSTLVKNKKQKKKRIKSGEEIFTIDIPEYTTTTSFNWPDTSNVYFDHRRYRIGGDVLIELDEEGRETKTVYNNGKTNTVNPGLIRPTLPEVLQPAGFKARPFRE